MKKAILAAVVAVILPLVNLQAAETNLEEDIMTVLFEERLAGATWALVSSCPEFAFHGKSGPRIRKLRFPNPLHFQQLSAADNGGASMHRVSSCPDFEYSGQELVNQRRKNTVLGAAGMRDNATQSRFTTDTRFHVGSVAKSLLATGVLRLATTRAIELDAPVSRYLPEVKMNNPWETTAEVTVRHLLDHTSGLNDAHMWQMFSERAKPDAPLIAAFPDPEVQLSIRSRPGARFSYSNMGFTLLGMIIESVTSESYEHYLDKHLLVPLEMHDSTFIYTTQQGARADPTLAWGHVDDGSRYAASPVFLRPAGQFTTTVGDLAKFAEFLLGDGVVQRDQFIDEALMRARGRPFATEAARGGLIAGYALGLGRRDRHGVVGYCHGGNIVGFVAMLCIFPTDGKAFAYSVNLDSETADYSRIDKLLIRELGIGAAEPPPSSKPSADIARWHGRYVLSPNRFQTFEYLDNVFGAIKISADGNSLLIQSLQNSPRRLRPVGGRIYSADDRATQSHVFVRNEHDEYLLSDGFQTYRKVSSIFLIAHWTSLLLGLAGIVWLFISGFVSLVRYRTRFWRRVGAPAFAALLLLLIPIPLFFTQSFMALGDITLASSTLALATGLLPVGMILSLQRAARGRGGSKTNLIHGVAAACVLQWCIVLIATDMMPLRLWR